MIYKNPLDLIGQTPIIEYEGVFIKLEQFNLAGSIKDRVALEMIRQLEIKKQIHENSTVIEVTSGNTGIAIAMICAIKRYRCIIIMLDDVSKEKINIIKAYGAKVILTPHKKGYIFSSVVARKLEEKYGFIYLDQFNNLYNPLAQEKTKEEIVKDFPFVDYLVCGIGTGGTITGLSKMLKEVWPNLKVVGVLPSEENHHICGIGADIKSSFLDYQLIDEIKYVSTKEASKEFNLLAKKGLLLGLSSSACFNVAKRIKEENPGKIVLMISADSGTKYTNTLDEDV